ncbi:Wat1-related protein, partial [Thalictrum thalictroides]
RRRPPLTFSLISKFFILGLIGTSALICGYTGIDYSSPALSSAISNLVPAFTFILAIIFSVLGSIVISLDFYGVIWGKSKEEKVFEDKSISSLESSPYEPLLGRGNCCPEKAFVDKEQNKSVTEDQKRNNI